MTSHTVRSFDDVSGSLSTWELSNLQEVAEQLGAIFWLVDAESGAFEYVCPAFEHVWGRPRAGVYASPRDWFDAVHGDDRPNVERAIGKRSEGAYLVEYRILRPDGEIRWIRDRGMPVRDARGSVRRIAGVAQDVTHQRSLEERLRLQSRAYTMLASVGAAIGEIHEPAKLLDEVCRVAVEEGGLRLAWIGRVDPVTGEIQPLASRGEVTFLEGIRISAHAERPEGHGPTGRAARAKRPELSFDFENDPRMEPWRERIARFGLRSSAATSFGLPDGARGVLTLYAAEVGVFTEREEPLVAQLARLTESGLRAIDSARRVELLARVVEQSSTMVVVTGTDGTIEYVNPRFTEATGYEAEELKGKTPGVLRAPATPPDVYREMWTTVLAGGTWQGSMQNVTKAGVVYDAQVKVSPLLDERGRITRLVGTHEDVTERTRLRARLERAQRLESLGLLAGGIAHDFNNILSAMTMYADNLCHELDEDTPPHEDAREILKCAERATNLTRQLLAFSRRQVIAPTDFELGTLASELGGMLRKLLGARIALVIHPAPQPVHVHADPGQIDHVLINLCVNARDAMPAGGRIDLSIDEVSFDASEAEGVGVSPGRYGLIRVRDNGTGMDRETMLRVFEPFFTTKNVERGTGLGLATCFGIVTQSGGNIVVSSQLGVGSTFEVLLPLATGHESAPPEAPAGPQARGT